jgi:hypothetical protein
VQWHDYLGALDHTFNAGDEALIDILVAPGHTSTPGYTDPSFRFLGGCRALESRNRGGTHSGMVAAMSRYRSTSRHLAALRQHARNHFHGAYRLVRLRL